MNKYYLIDLHNRELDSDGKQVILVPIIRKEHPNCAIFKKTVSTSDEDITRTTLFTPKKRITRDISLSDSNVRSHYVSSEKHLETLLFYLKDIEVSSNDTSILLADDSTVLVGELSFTPYKEMLERWLDASQYNAISASKDFTRCLHQIKKTILHEISCAKAVYEKYGISHFTFRDTIDVTDCDHFDRHYYEYYRLLNIELAECNVLVKISGDIADFSSTICRKHIAGALVAIDSQ